LADVRGALGPYLNVFLVTQQQWSQSNVGLVTMMISGLLGIAFQTPIGAAIDATRAKRGWWLSLWACWRSAPSRSTSCRPFGR
jgi:hypothetical protein